MNLVDLVSGSIVTKHIHLITLACGRYQLECVYENNDLTVATLIDSAGNFRYLNSDERSAIIDLVREHIGESPVISY